MSGFPPAEVPGELRDALPTEDWGAAIGQILARHGLPDADLAPFDTGSDVVWGTPDHVVKLTAPRWASEIDAEARLLAHVSGKLPVATPEPIATGQLDGWPYVVMRRLPGDALAQVWPTLTAAQRVRCASQLGELVAALHSLPTPDDGADWSPWLDDCRQHMATRQGQRGASESLVAEAEEILARWTPRPTPMVLLHTELLDQHIFALPDGTPSAVIDFADGRVGQAGYDLPALVEFILQGEPRALPALVSALSWPGDRDELLGWHLVHRYASLPRLLAAAGGALTLQQAGDRLHAGL